jgi:hypothetical protein
LPDDPVQFFDQAMRRMESVDSGGAGHAGRSAWRFLL